MEQKQMMLLLVVGVLVGAIGFYGIGSMTGYSWIHVHSDEAKAAGLHGNPISLNTRIQVETNKMLRELESRYPGDVITIARIPEIALSSDGTQFVVEKLAVLKDKVYDKALTDEVLGVLSEKFAQQLDDKQLVILEAKHGTIALGGGKGELGSVAAIGINSLIIGDIDLTILGAIDDNALLGYAIFDEVKAMIDDGLLEEGDQVIISAFDAMRFVLGEDDVDVKMGATPVYAVTVYKGIVPFGENPIDALATEQLVQRLGTDATFSGTLLVPMTSEQQLFNSGMIRAGVTAENPSAAILGIQDAFQAFEVLVGNQMPNSMPGGSTGNVV